MTDDTTKAEQRAAAAAEKRKTRRTRELALLLSTHPDLTGTYAPADWTVDAVRWSA